ncbi:MAG: sulfatase, partial [Phycisphaerae bacterium]
MLLGVAALGLFAWAGWMASKPVEPSDPDQADDAQVESATQPHVVIMLIDTLRADRLGVYGYGLTTSPNIDALAGESVVFEQCSAPAPWTLPSVASLLTSTFVCEHGLTVDKQKLAGGLIPLAERLKPLGYATASFFANFYAGPLSGLDRGYDLAKSVRFAAGAEISPWLDTVPSRPFHLYLHNIEPHNPYNAGDRFVQPFGQVLADDKELVKQAYLAYRRLTRADYAAKRRVGTTDNTSEQDAAMARLASIKPTIDVLYDAAVRKADFRVGRIIDLLKRRNLWDNTVFILTSDHGEELGDHGGWLHDQSVYEELLRVPLMVHFPGGRFAGRRLAESVSLIDVMPTILD